MHNPCLEPLSRVKLFDKYPLILILAVGLSYSACMVLYTAYTSPFGLYEYSHLPQGLCNSPTTFMRMMVAIFGDQNFLSLLCYLNDILVFAPTEDMALERLEMVFERLQAQNLKLAPKKYHFLQRLVQFLGHIVSAEGIATDPEKVRAITYLSEMDLMEDGSGASSQ